jgi:hypothetical protein
MIERSMERFDLYPAKLMGDSAYGSADMLGPLRCRLACRQSLEPIHFDLLAGFFNRIGH